MKNLIALLLCAVVLAGCGGAKEEAKSEAKSEAAEEAISASSEGQHDYEFVELDGLTFAYPAEWTLTNQTEDSVTFSPYGDKSVGVSIGLSDFSGGVSEEDFFVEFVTGKMERYDNYKYEFKTSGNKLVLEDTYTDEGAHVASYAAIYGNHLVFSVCMAKDSIPMDIQAHTMAMVHPVDGM